MQWLRHTMSLLFSDQVEVQGMIDASIRDAYALIEFYAFMEDQIVNKKVKATFPRSCGCSNQSCQVSPAEWFTSCRGNQGHAIFQALLSFTYLT